MIEATGTNRVAGRPLSHVAGHTQPRNQTPADWPVPEIVARALQRGSRQVSEPQATNLPPWVGVGRSSNGTFSVQYCVQYRNLLPYCTVLYENPRLLAWPGWLRNASAKIP